MDFLNNFDKRMKSVGRYAVLMSNSFQKTTWKQYDINTIDEQINIIFTVLLYIMEYSLKEEDCTLDDIAGFIGEVNDTFYKREWGYNDYKSMADFIVNKILSNDGISTYFQGFSYDKKEYVNINISYIANKVVYQENGIRRTSYYLTDDGYNMILSTMELENNLKLTVHEMLFKLHLEKADYGRAVNDIKNVFDQLRIQNQKIQEAMHRIRQNALSYTVEEYRQIVEENIDTIERTRGQFRAHKEVVEAKVQEFEEEQMESADFSGQEKQNLDNLRVINSYLARSIDEHQKILNEHFDLKSLYDKELENYSNMTMVQRFYFRSEIYDRVLQDASLLENIEEVFNPLFWGNADKIYNPGIAFEYQKRLKKSAQDDDSLELDFDEDAFNEEQQRKIQERLKKYHDSLNVILLELAQKREISLAKLRDDVYLEHKDELFPTAEIFREIMIEFLTEELIDIQLLKDERNEYFWETSESFRLNEMILQIIEENNFKNIHKIYVRPSETKEKVYFENVRDENGNMRNLKCANIDIWCE